MLHLRAEDERLDGRTVTVSGKKMVHFGSCSYLGLETHELLKSAAVDATMRFGTQFSSSRAYLSAPLYEAAESALSVIFGRDVLITASTTMGHLATLPTLVESTDVLLLDHQVHHSVQTAATLVRAQGARVEFVPHNDLRTLDRRLAEYRRRYRRVWYAADGLYSMYADHCPIDGLNALAERHEHLWLYLDDAHGLSWTGRHGRGYALEHLGAAAATRAVVAGSLNKSFAAAGGVLVFPDPESRRKVFTVGGPMIFSGPVQPPMLGAILGSARIHRSPLLPELQQRLLGLIRHFNALAADLRLPLVSDSEAPIRFVGAGLPHLAYDMVGRLHAAGYFVDTASFPAVPAKRSGVRLTLTAHHTEADVTGLAHTLAAALPRALAAGGSSAHHLARLFARQLDGRPVAGTELPPPPPAGALRLEHHDTIDTVAPTEWNALLGGRGSFDWAGLRTAEDVFAGPDPRPENVWRFHYWIVRDATGHPVAATFFTDTIWKDDMLAPSDVSAEVERQRATTPYHLTSRVLAMGSLITEGDHLYLDRGRDWRGALRLILDAARAEEDRIGAAGIVLRDLPDDEDLRLFLLGEGFARLPGRDNWQRPMDFADTDEFVGQLTKKARYHQRNRVLAVEARYRVDVVRGGSAAALGPADRDHLYDLYRRVHDRHLDLNVFPLPRRTIDAVLAHPCWEVVTLRLPERTARPVAFGAHHVGPDHVQGVFIGLDYDYVRTDDSYQQTLWQAIRCAQRHGSGRVLYGMGADRHKARFGARRHRSWLYVQSTDSLHRDLLGDIAQRLHLRPAVGEGRQLAGA
ncbi:aminotransferase class I/II-fold pyridoxal phosphate-dependent enzyme [Pilimelia anulata]|nr:aminotransferase class I/II-fold pyridoxal phosphate-dependent enzyme [Pilimelia anulata]